MINTYNICDQRSNRTMKYYRNCFRNSFIGQIRNSPKSTGWFLNSLLNYLQSQRQMLMLVTRWAVGGATFLPEDPRVKRDDPSVDSLGSRVMDMAQHRGAVLLVERLFLTTMADMADKSLAKVFKKQGLMWNGRLKLIRIHERLLRRVRNLESMYVDAIYKLDTTGQAAPSNDHKRHQSTQATWKPAQKNIKKQPKTFKTELFLPKDFYPTRRW